MVHCYSCAVVCIPTCILVMHNYRRLSATAQSPLSLKLPLLAPILPRLERVYGQFFKALLFLSFMVFPNYRDWYLSIRAKCLPGLPFSTSATHFRTFETLARQYEDHKALLADPSHELALLPESWTFTTVSGLDARQRMRKLTTHHLMQSHFTQHFAY